ncbi:MAG: hypothetical protein K9J13_08250, partial [Saprospiraceae bacterium]|nr:hypothetical protein [Saprospiraceae bacterium]
MLNNKTKLKHGFLIFSFIFFNTITLSAQVYDFKNLNVKDGLPSGEVYDAVQDSLGYLWFATEAGICKYDGYSFKTISQYQKHYDNSIVKLFKDIDGKIWFSTYRGKFGYILNNSMFFHRLCDSISIGGSFINNIYVDSTNKLWLTAYTGQLFISDEKQKKIIKNIAPTSKVELLLFKPFGKSWIYSTFRHYYGINDNKVRVKEGLKIIDGDYQIHINTPNYENTYYSRYCKIAENDYLVSISHHLFRIKDNEVVLMRILDDAIIDIFKDCQNKMWISVLRNGVLRYDINDLNNPELHLFEGRTISKVVQDYELNFWFSSIDKGIYFIPSMKFSIINGTSDKMINSLTFINNTDFYSQLHNGCLKINIGKRKVSEPKKVYLKSRIRKEIPELNSINNFLV